MAEDISQFSACLATENKRKPHKVMDRLVRLSGAMIMQCIHT